MNARASGGTKLEPPLPVSDEALALFRRAICEQDDQAWQQIIEQYRRLILGTIYRHSGSRLVVEDDLFWINRTFERFWMAIGPKRIDEFKDLPAIVSYLKMCALSVLMDALRERQRRPLVCEVDDAADDVGATTNPADEIADQMDAATLWATVQNALPDDRDVLIARLSLVHGMTPREIFARHGDRFTGIQDVYSTKRNLLGRLRNAPELQRYASARGHSRREPGRRRAH